MYISSYIINYLGTYIYAKVNEMELTENGKVVFAQSLLILVSFVR